jgi:hypothetical protein
MEDPRKALQGLANLVNGARRELLERHKDKEGLEKIEALCADAFALMVLNFKSKSISKAEIARFLSEHPDKQGIERLETLLLDIYGMLFVEFYMRPRE